MFTPVMFASILPEILILILAVILLCVEPFWREDQRRNAGWLTAGGLFAIIIVSWDFKWYKYFCKFYFVDHHRKQFLPNRCQNTRRFSVQCH